MYLNIEKAHNFGTDCLPKPEVLNRQVGGGGGSKYMNEQNMSGTLPAIRTPLPLLSSFLAQSFNYSWGAFTSYLSHLNIQFVTKKKKKKKNCYKYVPPQMMMHQLGPSTHAVGVLSGKVGTGMCGLDRVHFRPLRFINGPFFIWKLV